MDKKDEQSKHKNSDDFESISPEDLAGDDLNTSPTSTEKAGKQKQDDSEQGKPWIGASAKKLNKIQNKTIALLKQLLRLLNDLLDLKDIKGSLPPSLQEKLPDNPRLVTIPVLIFLLGFLVMLFLAIFAPTASKNEVSKAVPVVRVVEAKKEDIRIPVFSQGLVEPEKEIQIVSLVNGPVLEVSPNLVDGGKVEEGELLVRISDRSYVQDKARAQANLARAKSAQVAKQSELRVQGTLRTTSGRAQLIEVNSAVSAAEADLERVTDLIENTEIEAPFSGLIRRVSLQKGQVISAGTPIASLFSTEAAVVHIPLSDRQLSLLDRESLESESESYPSAIITGEFGNRQYYWKGNLVRFAGARNELNRLQYATVKIDAPYADDTKQPGRPHLAPGFFVEVNVTGKLFRNIVRLPRKALKTNERIWGVDDDGLLTTYNDAQIIHRDQEYLYVTSGIEENERIVISELEVFVKGIEVNPKFLEEETQVSNSLTMPETGDAEVHEVDDTPMDALEPQKDNTENVGLEKNEAVEEAPQSEVENNKVDRPES